MTTNYLQPLENHYQHEGVETALFQAMNKVFQQTLAKQVQNLVNYGTPFYGNRELLERFFKRDGLVILNRHTLNEKAMQAIYASWIAVGAKRGLGFLEFVLTMLWGNRWEIKPIYHSITHANKYPNYWQYKETNDSFLTSRIHLLLSETQDVQEAQEIAPTLRNIIPANIVLQVVSKGLDEEFKIGIASVGRTLQTVKINAII